jgi:hypothetical protein
MVRLILALIALTAGAVAPAVKAFAQDARAVPQGEVNCVSADRAPANAARLSALRRGIAGDIVRASICNQGGVWTYRITVLQPNGQVRTLLFDAASGAPLGR